LNHHQRRRRRQDEEGDGQNDFQAACHEGLAAPVSDRLPILPYLSIVRRRRLLFRQRHVGHLFPEALDHETHQLLEMDDPLLLRHQCLVETGNRVILKSQPTLQIIETTEIGSLAQADSSAVRPSNGTS
jgi:hypothetical protein